MTELLYQDFFGISDDVKIRINVTNICNIHCDHCDNNCHIPFSKKNELIFRKSPIVSNSESLEKFCSLVSGLGESNLHLLQGGEVTSLPIRLISSYIDVFAKYKRRIGMRTNGYNVSGFSEEDLNKFDCIYLNSHGINESAILYAYEYLEKNFQGRVIMEETLYHRDLTSIINHGTGSIEQGLKCTHIMSTLTFMPPVILPCCNTWAIANATNSSYMLDLLIDHGWSIHNDNLKETLQNWRDSLPRQFFKDFCANSCYLTNSNEMKLYEIKSHHKDKVLKINKD
jgi:hypothetical protein